MYYSDSLMYVNIAKNKVEPTLSGIIRDKLISFSQPQAVNIRTLDNKDVKPIFLNVGLYKVDINKN